VRGSATFHSGKIRHVERPWPAYLTWESARHFESLADGRHGPRADVYVDVTKPLPFAGTTPSTSHISEGIEHSLAAGTLSCDSERILSRSGALC